MIKKTKSITSPKGGNRGCLCADGTYSKKCCNGYLQNQGIGSTIGGGEGTVTNPKLLWNGADRYWDKYDDTWESDDAARIISSQRG